MSKVTCFVLKFSRPDNFCSAVVFLLFYLHAMSFAFTATFCRFSFLTDFVVERIRLSGDLIEEMVCFGVDDDELVTHIC